MRSAARSLRRPDPAPRAPARPGPGLCPAPARWAPQVSARPRSRPRPRAAPAPAAPSTLTPRAGRGAGPGAPARRPRRARTPAPRPAPRAGVASLPPSSPEKVAILVHCLWAPPSPGARDRPFRGHAGPAPAAGDRWVARPAPRCASPGRPHPRARAQAGVPGRAAWAAVPPPASPAVSARRSYPPPPEGPTSAILLAPLGRGEPFLLLVRESQALNGRGVSAS